MAHLARVLISGGVFLLLAGIWGYLSFLDFQLYTVATPLEVTIPRGWGVVRVGELLEESGAIHSRAWFVLVHGLTRQGPVQAGEYRFETGDDAEKIMKRLVRGEVIQHRLTLPEGLTVREVAQTMAETGFNDAMKLVEDPTLVGLMGLDATTLEGWLFPDTYFFRKETSLLDMVRRMADRSRQVLNSEWARREQGVDLTPYQTLILASMVEKETGLAEERTHIAGVFHNRLKRKMRLQSDPTVIYGIPGFAGDLTRKDLITPTPYNTYTIDHLPPTPICNPGQASIHATLHPEKTEDLYFVATGQGGHVFSRTLAEHNRHVQQYQKRKKGGEGPDKNS